MDPSRFDALARSFTASTSRRAALAGLIAGLAAFVIPEREAGAKRRQRRDTGRAQSHHAPRAGGAAVGIEKKKKRKKKPCKPACTGKTCGSNGCKGNCGSCASGESCVGGNCVPDSGSCSPACIGGQECQPNGQCACPAPLKDCGATLGCRECCSVAHCSGDGFQECRHDLGGICVCRDGKHACGEFGICLTCCANEHCDGADHHADGFICTTRNTCECQGASSPCVKPGGLSSACKDLQNDEYNCGKCGFYCQGWNCLNGVCTPS